MLLLTFIRGVGTVVQITGKVMVVSEDMLASFPVEFGVWERNRFSQ